MSTRGTTKYVKGIMALSIVMVMLVGLLGTIQPQNHVSAAEGVVESETISYTPQKITGLKDMGLNSIVKALTPAKNPGKIDYANNRVDFSNTSSTDYSVSNGYKKYVLSGSTLSQSVPISMEHSWELNMNVLIARCEGNIGAQMLFTFAGTTDTISMSAVNNSTNSNSLTLTSSNGKSSSKTTVSSSKFGVEKDVIVSYDAGTDILTWKYGNETLSIVSPCSNDKTLKLSVYGNIFWDTAKYAVGSTPADSNGVIRNSVYLKFGSFQYKDYYMKATNYITDYMGRRILGAVGNGHTIEVHPTILNDASSSQRYSGTIELNTTSSRPLTNLTLTGDIAAASQAIDFKHTNSLYQDMKFKANVTSGDYNSTSGKKFFLPLLITDNYFSKNAELIALSNNPDSGAPGTWHNLKKDGTDQLPLELNLERDTYRKLVSDLNKTSGLSDCDYTRNFQPTTHGWYSRDINLNLKSDEFDELSISSANINAADNNTISASNILKTGSSLLFNGAGSTTNGETGQDGVTYSIFARKGDSNTTSYLSAVSTETFRIDKTAPTITQSDEDRKNRLLRLKDEPASSGTDEQGNEVKGSGIAYVEWLTPSEAESGNANWPSDNPDLFSQSNGGWPSKIDNTRHVIPVAASLNATTSDTSVNTVMPVFNEEGTYIFRAVDLAGNVSAEKKIGNHYPELSAAKSTTVKYADTIKDFVPKNVLNASVIDQDELLDTTKVSWKIEAADQAEYPESFDPISGQQGAKLPSALPLGTYKVTISMIGTDSDGNVPKQGEKKPEDRNKLVVTLKVVAGDPPIVTNKATGDTVNPDNPAVIQDDTSKHTIVTGKKILIVDPQNYYSDGKIIGDELAQEVEKEYDFTSLLSAPKNELTKKVTLYKDGVDFTAAGINTKTEGEYIISYQVSDASGCSVTMQFTYQVRTDLNVTFHTGKGDFKDPAGTQTKTIRVKYDRAPKLSDIPVKDDILAPVEKVFIGWGTTLNSQSIIDPDSRSVTEDVTYYAVYADDMNRDSIPDDEEAIFFFKSGNADHAAFKYTDRTVVGLPVPPLTGSEAYLTAGKIPEILFDSGYRLKGWKTDITGDQLLTTEQLCSIGRGRGTKTTVTAITEEAPVEYNNKVVITFFSSAPKVSPLKGGEGQTIVIDAPKPGEPVSIPKEKLPEVSLAENTTLEGWKTSDTGDMILEVDDITAQKLYGGKELTCIAYVDVPKEEVTVPDTKPDVNPTPAPDTKPNKDSDRKDNSNQNTNQKNTEKTVVKTKKVTKVQKETTQEYQDITFIFYTSSAKSGTIKSGDGTSVNLPAGKDGTASLTENYIPRLSIAKENKFLGWKTSMTGDQIISDKQLCGLKVRAGSTVICTAYFKYPEIQIESSKEGKAQTSKEIGLTTFNDSQTPLGGIANAARKMERKNSSCIVHFIMLVWLLLSILTICRRIHSRKRTGEYLYPDGTEISEEFRSAEDYENLARDQRTGVKDYVFTACDLAVGLVLFMVGTCMYEIPLLIIGTLFCLYYLLRMKMLDRKDQKAVKQLVNEVK